MTQVTNLQKLVLIANICKRAEKLSDTRIVNICKRGESPIDMGKLYMGTIYDGIRELDFYLKTRILILQMNRSVQAFDNRPDDRKPQANTTCPFVTGIIDPFKRQQDTIKKFRRHSAAMISHKNSNQMVGVIDKRCDRNDGMRVSVMNGIVNKVGYCNLEKRSVCHQSQSSGDFHIYRAVF